MTDLTATELARLRRKIGDVSTPPAFPDDELQDIWSETGENWNLTLVECFNELIAQAVKETDYTQNESQEKKSSVVGGLIKLRDYYQGLADNVAGATGMRIVPLKVTRRDKCYPDDGHNYRRSNARLNELDDDSL